MLRPDSRLPQRDWAWSRARVAELLAAQVLPRLRPGLRLEGVHREYVAYKAGKECLAHYSVRCAGEQPWRVTLTFGDPERLGILYGRHYAGAGEGGRALLLSDPPCLVEPFPSDWKLADLAAAANPRDAARLLGLGADGGSVREVELVRYRPRRRCVLRYGSSEAGDAMVKVYAYASKAREVREKLVRLGPAARARGLVLPRPRGDANGHALLLMERVPGRNLGSLLDESPVEAGRVARLAGRALAAFHSLALETRETRTFEDEIRRLELRAGRLVEAAPRIAQRIDRLLERVTARLAAIGPEPRCLVHGDFKPSQLLVEGETPALVDLDRACLGDPSLDLGNFLAVLVKQDVLKGAQDVADAGREFLAAYREAAPHPAHEGRVRLFQAFALGRMLVRKLERAPHAFQRNGEEWQPLQLLDESERCVDGS